MQTVAKGNDAFEHGMGLREGRRPTRGASRARPRAFGWFSLALGAGLITAPDSVSRLIGVKKNRRVRKVMRAVGVREIASGVGLLAGTRKSPCLWARALGDVIDLGLLGRALALPRTRRDRGVSALAALAGIALLDAAAARATSKSTSPGVVVKRAITVNRTVAECMRFGETSRTFRGSWRTSWGACRGGPFAMAASGPLGTVFRWEAEVVADEPNRRLAWKSLPGSQVMHQGEVEFRPAPGNRGTEILVDLRYLPPAGRAGASIAKLFGKEPSQEIAADLRRLKQVIETGEVVHSDASIHRGMHPAQPSPRTDRSNGRQVSK